MAHAIRQTLRALDPARKRDTVTRQGVDGMVELWDMVQHHPLAKSFIGSKLHRAGMLTHAALQLADMSRQPGEQVLDALARLVVWTEASADYTPPTTMVDADASTVIR